MSDSYDRNDRTKNVFVSSLCCVINGVYRSARSRLVSSLLFLHHYVLIGEEDKGFLVLVWLNSHSNFGRTRTLAICDLD